MAITKYIILATQRSGSTWLVDMLNSHKEIISYSELFLKNAAKDKPTWAGKKDILLRQAYLRKTNKGIFQRFRPFSCFRYLDYVFHSYNEGINSIGFKLMYNQLLNFPEILVYLLFNRVYIIHLIRRNILDIILSKEAILMRGSHHSIENVNQVQVKLNTSNLLDRLRCGDRKIKLGTLLFYCLGLPYIEVEYEKLKSNPSIFNDILNFLGIEPKKEKLETSLKKLNKGSHMEIISNYEEVRNTLKDTKYYDLLDQK